MQGDKLASGAKSATFYPAKQEPAVNDTRTDYSEEAVAARAKKAFEDRARHLAEQKIENEKAFARALETGAKVKPVGDKVLLWRVPEIESLIEQADIAARLPLVCVVCAVSDRPSDAYSKAALESLHVGDTVTVLSQTGTDIAVDGTAFVVLHVHDILVRLGDE